jgi:hypothetical protein
MNLFVRKNATLKARPILGRVQFQYRPQDQEKPLESGEPIDFGGDIDRVDLPLVGDFVHLPSQGISGIVESRLFWYVQNGSNTSYLVNIVVTDTEVELTKLINVESAA